MTSSFSLRSFMLGMASVYLLVAVMSGTAMYRAIPAMNAIGGVYVGSTWPVAMFCSATQIEGCSALPPAGSSLANAFFTFSEAP